MPDELERVISPRTKAVMPVHFGGHPCEMDASARSPERRGIRVVEDAAHALPAAYDGRRVGTIGDLTCFSFYATKTITTGEGGMVTTENDEYAERMRIMSLHGISRDAWKRYTAEGSWYYEILQPGFKYNLTDMAAALGIEQLKRCHAFRDSRRRIAEQYDQGFADLEEMVTPMLDTATSITPGICMSSSCSSIGCGSAAPNSSKRSRRSRSAHRCISSRCICIRTIATDGGTGRKICRTRARHSNASSLLPIYPGMTDDDVQDVIGAVRGICAAHRR